MMKTAGYIIKIKKLSKLWRIRQQTIEGKILIFKTLTISKVADLVLVKDVPSPIIAELEQNTKAIYLKKRNF